MGFHCNEILQSYNISQNVFDRSVEFHNDSDILLAIERLSLSEPLQDLQLTTAVILRVVDFYNRNFKLMIETVDPKLFDSQTFLTQIEDRIYSEFGFELNDVIQHYLSSEDWDVKSKVNELRQSFSSVQKLNQSLFELCD